MAEKKKSKRFVKPVLFSLIGVVVLAGVGWGYLQYANREQAAAAEVDTGYKTAQVRSGSLIISAAGSGTLTAGKQAALSFPIAGKVGVVNVQVGDTVEAGQVLAELEDQSMLKANLNAAELDLKLAEQAVEELKTNAAVKLANAKIDQISAQTVYDDALYDRKKLDYSRGSAETIASARAQYYLAQDEVERLEAVYGNFSSRSEDDPQRALALTSLEAAKTKLKSALINLNWYTGHYSEADYNEADANEALAQAKLEIARAKVALLEANNGIDPTEMAQAEAKVVNAQISLDKAKDNLEGAVMTAPFAGTVLTVAGEAGDTVGTGAFITLIDMFNPVIKFSVDETDMDKVAIGAPVDILFDAIPDTIFTGTVSQISPTLASMGGYNILSGEIKLDSLDGSGSVRLLEGLSASVEIVAGKAENVLLVPVEAVRDLGDGDYGVFLIGEDGSARLRVVEVGLMDATYAEIKSGLALGDTVTTGAVETN